MKEFLLNDESVNSYGFIVLTKGINMERFLNNPVMFLNHDREKGVAGRWENLRIENNKLFGSPVFDTLHEPGKTAQEQVNDQFLKGASIGIRNIVYDEKIPGTRLVTSCELLEVSVCDIPSNRNSTQLYFDDKNVDFDTYLKLSAKTKNMSENKDFQLVLQALSLPDQATMKDVLASVKSLQSSMSCSGLSGNMLNLACQEGIISKKEKDSLLSLFGEKPEQLDKYLQDRKNEHLKTLSSDYDLFVQSHPKKFRYQLGGFVNGELKEFALKDYPVFKKFIESIPDQSSVTEFLKTNTGSSANDRRKKAEWTLEDYRKHAPVELRQTPGLYQELLEKERNQKEQ